ncbi:FAD-dependent oxidoreductase [Streptomyces sp. NPDC005930]|uniref:FAD-dependent oxidoreductase n=1 Tax=Streptomyces sp. NPDC005930 TaxID=3364736 RepID=UPI0036C243FA
MAGAGPAGMETDRSLAERGRRVGLWEADERVGGAFRLAAGLRRHPDYGPFLNRLAGEMVRHGVRVRTGTPVDADLLATRNDDAVVLATGERGRLPADLSSTGVGRRHVVPVRDWPRSGQEAHQCVIWGADREGVATADRMAACGVRVVLIGSQSSLAPDVGRRAKTVTAPRPEGQPHVRIVLDAALTAVDEQRVQRATRTHYGGASPLPRGRQRLCTRRFKPVRVLPRPSGKEAVTRPAADRRAGPRPVTSHGILHLIFITNWFVQSCVERS